MLRPIALPLKVERAEWRSFMRDGAAEYHRQHRRVDRAVMMLLPRPTAMPVLALVDEYDSESAIQAQLAEMARHPPEYAENAHGDVVVIFPLDYRDDDEKDRQIELARLAAEMLDANAVGIVAECWVRGIDGAPGTGTDSVMVICEQRHHTPMTYFAPVKAGKLGAWTAMPGEARGAMCGWFPADDDAEPEAPEGFTAKVNVATVGEA